MNNYLNKRGLSGVIITLILIALTLVAALIVWGVVNNLLYEQINEAESCSSVFGKIEINNRYTCYNSSSDEVQFSVSVKDIELDSIVVSVFSSGASTSYTLSESANTDLSGYSGGTTTIPGQNSGKTYLASGYTSEPDLIEIAPVINDNQCDTVDSLSDIDDCQSLA